MAYAVPITNSHPDLIAYSVPITHPQFRQDHKSLKIVINDWEIPTNLLTLNMISSIEIGFYE